MTILTVAQRIARRVSEDVPTVVVGSPDTSAAFLLEIIEQAAEEIVRAAPWQALRREHTWTATATEEQSSAFPADFSRVVKGTFWNRNDERQVLGPYDPAEWQRLKATISTAVFDQYTVRNGAMLIDPVPTAGDVYAYEYLTSHWWEDAGGAGKAAITVDTDVFRLDEMLLRLWGIYLFRLDKGLDYERDEMRARAMLLQLAAQEKGGARTLDLSGGRMVDMVQPGGASTEGNWPL